MSNNTVVLTNDLRDRLLTVVRANGLGLKSPSRKTVLALYSACLDHANGDVSVTDRLMQRFLAIRYEIMLDEARPILATAKADHAAGVENAKARAEADETAKGKVTA